jgi:hypothetical protein
MNNKEEFLEEYHNENKTIYYFEDDDPFINFN